jgi:hypothetical protein
MRTAFFLACAMLVLGCKTEPTATAEDGGGGAATKPPATKPADDAPTKPADDPAAKPSDVPVVERKAPIETLCARYVDLAEAGGPKFVQVVRQAKLDKCAARAKDLEIPLYNCVVTCTQAAKDYVTARGCRNGCRAYGSKGGAPGGIGGAGGPPGKTGGGLEGAQGAAPSASADRGGADDDVP